MTRSSGTNNQAVDLPDGCVDDENDVFDERTGVYNENFLRTTNCVVENHQSTPAKEEVIDRISSVEELRTSTNGKLSNTTKYNYILPTRFEHGDHMETYLVQDMPISVALMSNATFKDIEPAQKARLGVAAARFSDDQINLTLLHFNLQTHEHRQSVPQLLLKARQQKNIDHFDSFEGLIGGLKVTISPKEKVIEAQASLHAAPCYLIRGRKIFEVTRLGKSELQSGDIVLMLTKGVVDALISHVTKKAYNEVVPALSQPKEDTKMNHLPVDFVEQETANQIHGLITTSQFNGYVRKDGKKVLERRLSPQKLFKILTAIYHKEQKAIPTDEVITDAFAVYQVP